MKKIIFLTVLFASTNAYANMSCGFKPFAPFNCKQICVCDDFGSNCSWINICK